MDRGGERHWLSQPTAPGGRISPGAHLVLSAGEQTKALVTQLTLFNQLLTELREDIRDQVSWWDAIGSPWAVFPKSTVAARAGHPPDGPCTLCR